MYCYVTNMSEVLSILEERLAEPTARGLATAVTTAVRDGALMPGTKLPPIRTVAVQLGISPTTVSAGWALLARSGAIHTDGRRGTTIADNQPPGSARYRRVLQRHTTFDLDLSTGIPDPELLPDLSRALTSLRTAGTPDSYLDEPVLPGLIEVLRRDWPYDAEAFTIVDGAMDALELAARSLVRFGDRVIVEHPAFPPLFDLLESLGARVVGVAVDEEGMSSAGLAAALAGPVTAVLLQPRAQNPTGVSLSKSRASDIAVMVEQSGVTVIEDDSAGAVATTDALSLGQWLPSQVLHIRSFSKSHGPDLRLAAMSGPHDKINNISGRRQLGQGWSSRLLQQILLGLLTDDHSVKQVAYARQEYGRRRNAVVKALAAQGIDVGGNDGINIWVPVLDESAAVLRLASQGIGVAPGSPFAVLPGQTGRIRVTVGLLGDRHDEVAAQLAAAARTGGWTSPR
jgi:DNA-binding transcriptional MocR family regulator